MYIACIRRMLAVEDYTKRNPIRGIAAPQYTSDIS